ncbi:hypothetical protein ACI65C_013356 [Semiaphis heraclei]
MANGNSRDDIADFLTAWELSQYIDTFQANDIDMKTLPCLNNEIIKELIPIAGHRARFISNLEQWKSIVIQGLPNVVESCSDIFIEQSSSSEQSIETIKLFYEDLQNVADNTMSTQSKNTHIASQPTTGLLEWLKGTNEGRSLLASYQESGLLDSIGRKRLCNLIISNELSVDVNVRVSSVRLQELAYEITTIFNKERTPTYFIPYLSYGPGLKRAAKGKLLDCLNNRRREFRKSGIIKSLRRSSTPSSGCGSPALLLPEALQQIVENQTDNPASVEESLNWLRNCSDPWSLVEENWALTADTRLKAQISNDGQSIGAYMSEYPALKKPTGYFLILKDFDVAYPGYSNKLYQNLPLYKKKILELTGEKLKKTKENTIIQILKEYIQLGAEDNEEVSNIAVLLSLPFLIGVSISRTKKSKIQWRASKQEMRDGFITHVRSNAEVQATITHRRDKLVGLGHTLQPFIIIVVPTLKEISNYLVVVDNIFYQLNSIVASVDCCFKIIITLNAEYSVECETVWYFIQKGFYNLQTPFDKNFTAVNTFLSDVVDSIKSLFKHFDLQHLNHEFHFFQCNEEDCSRSFYLKNSFRKHLSKHTNPILPSITERCHETSFNLDSTPILNPISDFVSLDENNRKQFIEPSKTLNQILCKFLSCLYANPIIPRNAVQIVVDGMETVFTEGIAVCIKTYVEQMIFEGQLPAECVLQKFFSLENVLSETFDFMATLKNNSGVITNFIQGRQTRIKHHEGRLVLPLFMFFDDYESGNVLGSHSGIHKLGAVYVSIPCLPPYRSTSLSNIFLALLFHSSDRLQFGNRVIFNSIIDEFNFLMKTGVYIDSLQFKGTIYFELGLILGDNLGLHTITGLVESFSSNFCCRICTMNKENIKTQCYEDQSLLRSTEQYLIDVERNDLSSTGIKEKCVWLDVNDFSLFNQVGVDVMHDMFEGCCKYVMSFILVYYIKELKLFSLEVLNDRISCFDFGPESNKPCTLSMEHINVGKVRQSASEMLILIRYFALLIGDFVPLGEPIWDLYLTMRKVIDIMLSTSLEENNCTLLETLIGPTRFINPSKLKQIQVELNLRTEKPLTHINWAEIKGTYYRSGTTMYFVRVTRPVSPSRVKVRVTINSKLTKKMDFTTKS